MDGANVLICNKLADLAFTGNDLQRTAESSVSMEITLNRRIH